MPSSPDRARPARTAGARTALTGLLAAAVVVLAAGLGAAPAAAHARFTGSDPAEGAQLPQPPTAVVLSYSEDVAPQFVQTAVITPDGATVPTTASADGRDVTVDLGAADLETDGGKYQVVARVVSVDGHPVEHTTTFVVPEPSEPAVLPPSDASDAPDTTGQAAPAASSVPTDPTTVLAASPSPDAGETSVDDDPAAGLTDGLPRWAVVAGAAALVLAAGAALLVQLRRRPPTG